MTCYESRPTWSGYEQCNDRLGTRITHWRRVLNNLGPFGVEWTPYKDEQFVDILLERFLEAQDTWRAAAQWLPAYSRAPLILGDMHEMDGRLGSGEWYPDFLSGWYGLWRDRDTNLVPVDHNFGVRSSRRYLQWYFQWARLSLLGVDD
ncbi:hypothetical protein PIB30_017344 [Stylosanthes scabra]|uniref:Uncharacterized protein n=1 Tax=Stylosanthes scabra TaxID=79078 RepID=A0ABU6T7V6_9FABA|nr:hypothetical protein [Stylosanthes scabra]